MRIAIYSNDFPWAGGVDFLHFLVKCLLTQKKENVQVFLFVNDLKVPIKQTAERRIINFLKQGYGLLKHPSKLKSFIPFKRWEKQIENADYSSINNIKEVFENENIEIVFYNDQCDRGKLELFKSLSIDVILPVLNNSFPYNYPVPWIGYLFDFVYKYHTHLYAKEFCLSFDIKYAKTLMEAKSVIVNSKRTYNDVYKFYPYAKANVYALPFAPFTNEYIYKEAVAYTEIKSKYKLIKPYFIISNQFWLHKSHETAFEALKILKRDYAKKDVEIVCTGKMTDLSGTDERKQQLLILLEELELTNDIHFVGHIPKIDQLALMLRSVAVIQPTLFEGGPGGGSVYMAVANGVPAIVSDIEVNREITDEPLVTFFQASNAIDLAAKMNEALLKEREALPYEAVMERNKRRLEYGGEILIESIHHSIDS